MNLQSVVVIASSLFLTSCASIIPCKKSIDEHQSRILKLENSISILERKHKLFSDSTRNVLKGVGSVASIGFVNLDSAIANYPKYASAGKLAEKEQAEYMKRVEKLRRDLNNFDGIEDVPGVIKNMKQQVLIVNAIQQLMQDARANTQKRIEPLAMNIDKAIQDVAREKNLSLIIKNSDAIYMNPHSTSMIDITADVIRKLRQY